MIIKHTYTHTHTHTHTQSAALRRVLNELCGPLVGLILPALCYAKEKQCQAGAHHDLYLKVLVMPENHK